MVAMMGSHLLMAFSPHLMGNQMTAIKSVSERQKQTISSFPPPLLASLPWELGFHFAEVHGKTCDCCHSAAVLRSCWLLVQSFEEPFPYRSFSPQLIHWFSDFFFLLFFCFQSQRHINKQTLPCVSIASTFSFVPFLASSPGPFPDSLQVLQILHVKPLPARARGCCSIWSGPGEHQT